MIGAVFESEPNLFNVFPEEVSVSILSGVEDVADSLGGIVGVFNSHRGSKVVISAIAGSGGFTRVVHVCSFDTSAT